MYQETSNSQTPTHTRPTNDSKQAIQVRPDHSDRVVSSSRGIRGNMQQVALASDRPQETSNSQSPTHTRPTNDSKQAIQVRPDHSDRVVSSSRGIRGNMQQVALASDRPICHQFQQQVASICVPDARSPGHSSGRTQFAMGRSGCIRLPTSGHLGQSGGEVAGHPLQETYSNYPGVAQHDLVWGSSVHVQLDPTMPTKAAPFIDTTLQSDPPQESDKS